MSRNLATEEQVRRELGIKDYASISPSQIKKLVKLLPDTDKNVAFSVISQLPDFARTATVMVAQMNHMCDCLLESNKLSHKEAIDGYKTILNNLSKLLEKEYVTQEEQRWVIERMIEVGDRISQKDTENKQFLAAMFGIGAGIVGLVGLGLFAYNMLQEDDENENTDEKNIEDYLWPDCIDIPEAVVPQMDMDISFLEELE